MSLALEARSLIHLTTREDPSMLLGWPKSFFGFKASLMAQMVKKSKSGSVLSMEFSRPEYCCG